MEPVAAPVALQNELARAALGGDRLALRQFLVHIAPAVRGICRSVIGRDSSELEDVIQDCLIEVVRALPKFRFESDVSHYVGKISLRRAIGLRKRLRAQMKSSLADTVASHVETFDDARAARAVLVRNLLDEMNEDQAMALRLRLMLGYSTTEIAEITGVSVNTVKTRLRLGKNQLRQWLKRIGEGPRARSV